MLIKAFFSDDIAHISYLLIGKSGIFAIDPQRDISVYEEEIKKRDLPLKGILLTHPHADFISGHREMQEKYKAPVYAHKKAPYQTGFHAVEEGDELNLDHIKIQVLDTPGHTPFCNSFLVTDFSRGNKPVAVFTGDTLFVGDAGRPDLFPEQKVELAGKLYDSLFDKLLKLDDFVEVYPAHASGSLCGKSLSEKRATTIGYEKLFNPRLQHTKKEAFIQEILADDLPVPEHFKYCAGKNLKGPALLENIPDAKAIPTEEFAKKMSTGNYTLIDIRNFNQWNQYHLPGSISIDINCLAFANYAGWIIPQEKEILLVHSSEEDIEKAVVSLRKIGIDQPVYYAENGMEGMLYHGMEIQQTTTYLPSELPKLNFKKEKTILLDVRQNKEEGKYPLAYIHQPASSILSERFLPEKNKEYIVICEKGALASLVISFLQNKGFDNISYLLGSGKTLRKVTVL